MSILELDHISYTYQKTHAKVLSDICTGFESGKFYAIVGTSGAGKSTLLTLLAGLDTPTQGTVKFRGEDIRAKGYARHRREHISLVFQNYNLIDYLSPLENLRLVNRKAKVRDLEELGIDAQQARRNVLQLSGGQQQRVAIGRALASRAPIILADEPTGNLDEKTAEEVTEILRTAARGGKCVIAVTHSKQLAEAADITLCLKGRRLTKQ